ncbi:aldehyde reductase [Amycolatopsis sp.]|uniref:SDR family oxidoreductase n=1 Tax=Amycolatopsis sp. TaxID=37632 RepID=UPI002BC5F714|nr:aldehyde reductase [Amycolatopsis sp.]HVV09847.1 aldehyde reductase [Amycolatopsis sp.]
MAVDRVLVTGATGFLAAHCIEELLTHGYRVRGSVRDLRTAQTAHLREIAEHAGGELEFVEVTLDSDAGWAEAVAGCAYVLHVASPFPDRIPKDENELIKPAVEGTLRVLRAANAGGVRRVVLTSSVAAISYGHDDSRTLTEADWTLLDAADAYPKSKTLAERAAWEYAGESGLELVAINPGAIFGPLLRPQRPTSMEAVRRIMSGQLPALPRIGWSPVDVRDLATAHRLAMEQPEAAGNRYICAGSHLWMRDMARILAGEYAPRGYSIATRSMPYWLMWILGRFDSTVRLALGFYGHNQTVSAAKAADELGWTMRPVRETIVDAAESLIRHGVVTAKGDPRPSTVDGSSLPQRSRR